MGLASDGIIITNNNNHDPDGHLCVVCMDNERRCLYVPCYHLAVCSKCDAEIIMALWWRLSSLPCPMCNTATERGEERVAGGVVDRSGEEVTQCAVLLYSVAL